MPQIKLKLWSTSLQSSFVGFWYCFFIIVFIFCLILKKFVVLKNFSKQETGITDEAQP